MRRTIGCLGPTLVFLGLGINACEAITNLSGRSTSEDLSGYSPEARAGYLLTTAVLRFGLIGVGLLLIVVALIRSSAVRRPAHREPIAPLVVSRAPTRPSARDWPSTTMPTVATPLPHAAAKPAEPPRRAVVTTLVAAALGATLLVGIIAVLAFASHGSTGADATTTRPGVTPLASCAAPAAGWPAPRFGDSIDISQAVQLPPGARSWAPADPSALGPQAANATTGPVHAYAALCARDSNGRVFAVEATRHDLPLTDPEATLRRIVPSPDDRRPIATGDRTLGGVGSGGERVLAVDHRSWLLTIRSTSPEPSVARDLAEMLLVLNPDL